MRCPDCNKFRAPTCETADADACGETVAVRAEAECEDCGSTMAEWSTDIDLPDALRAAVLAAHERVVARTGERCSPDLVSDVDGSVDVECVDVNANEGLATKAGKPRAPRWVPGIVLRFSVTARCECLACEEAREGVEADEPDSADIEHTVAFEDFEAVC